MKKLPVYIATFIGMFASLYSPSIHAQFFKKIMNTVKQTAQDKLNNKAQQTTNNVLDKADNSLFGKPNSTNNNNTNMPTMPGDTSAIKRVLGGFAKAAQDNPNDTSMSDLLAKSLGNIMGGNGVSSYDSAQAIQAFKITGGGSAPCAYYEITNTVIAKGRQSQTITKNWFTADGRGRGQMDLAGLMAAMMGQKINSKPVVVISRRSMPTYSITLDDQTKTYSLNIIDTSLLNENKDSWQATKIGNETIGRYHCIHLKLTSKKQAIDMWTSTDVPGYSMYAKLANPPQGAAGISMLNAIKQAGGEGYIVKMSVQNRDVSEVMLLTKAQLQPCINYNYFVIPPGYTEAKNNGIMTNLMQAGQQ